MTSPAGAAETPTAFQVTATITFTVVVADDEAFDAVCEDTHEALGQLMFDQDWQGKVELSWAPLAPDGAELDEGE